jgi:iron complex outermembrane receptor protein
VVSHTYEAGLRGFVDLVGLKGRLDWSIGAFHTINEDDILSVPSTVTGRGYFQNVGDTQRRGVEVSARCRDERFSVHLGYTYVDATFLDPITLASPNNPQADADGNIQVVPGNRIPAIPQHRFKAGGDYKVTDHWTVGVDATVVGSQYFVGDESNLNERLPAYWTATLRTVYKIDEHVEVFGLVQNLFDKRYYTFGTYFDIDAVPLGLADPRTLSPGAPLTVYAGIRGKL